MGDCQEPLGRPDRDRWGGLISGRDLTLEDRLIELGNLLYGIGLARHNFPAPLPARPWHLSRREARNLGQRQLHAAQVFRR